MKFNYKSESFNTMAQCKREIALLKSELCKAFTHYQNLKKLLKYVSKCFSIVFIARQTTYKGGRTHVHTLGRVGSEKIYR